MYLKWKYTLGYAGDITVCWECYLKGINGSEGKDI
jgi:hypothetical protein